MYFASLNAVKEKIMAVCGQQVQVTLIAAQVNNSKQKHSWGMDKLGILQFRLERTVIYMLHKAYAH